MIARTPRYDFAVGSFLLATRVVLAAVFVAAAAGKLLDLPGSRRALGEFGVPQRLAAVAGTALPLVELAAAALLLARTSARWGAFLALVLLLSFVAGMARALARGQAPDCHCFGAIHSEPVSRLALARNVALAALAAFAALRGPGPSIAEWVAARSAAELVAVVATAAATILAALCLKLWLANRRLRQSQPEAPVAATEPLPVGARAPRFMLATARGETITLDALSARGLPVALVFLEPACGPCQLLMPSLARWQATLADRLTLALVSTGTPEEHQETLEKHAVSDFLLQKDSEVSGAYAIQGTPSALVLTPGQTIASSPAAGSIEVEALIRLTLRRGVKRTEPEEALTVFQYPAAAS
jgi:peroxiredoxin/uncharacterized membrane protein YphA (DoxX/SURF4 family)